jgi:hypothetical protein
MDSKKSRLQKTIPGKGFFPGLVSVLISADFRMQHLILIAGHATANNMPFAARR